MQKTVATATADNKIRDNFILLPFVKTLLYKNNTTKPYQFPNKTIKASRHMVVINDLIVNKKT